MHYETDEERAARERDDARLRRFLLAAFLAFPVMVACVARAPSVTAAPVVVAEVSKEDSFAGVRERADAGVPVIKVIPKREPAVWQKKPPCDSEVDEHLIYGACWQATSRKPPCGALYLHEGACYRPISKADREPTSVKH